jgi:hypothetical protein
MEKLTDDELAFDDARLYFCRMLTRKKLRKDYDSSRIFEDKGKGKTACS